MKVNAPAPTTDVISRFSSLTKRAAGFPAWCYPAASGLVTIVAVFLRLGLWHHRLSVPFVYGGDALYETVLVKALSEDTWNYFIPQLGAPFGGMATVDFPLGCSLDFAIIKILSFVLRNPFFLIN